MFGLEKSSLTTLNDRLASTDPGKIHNLAEEYYLKPDRTLDLIKEVAMTDIDDSELFFVSDLLSQIVVQAGLGLENRDAYAQQFTSDVVQTVAKVADVGKLTLEGSMLLGEIWYIFTRSIPESFNRIFGHNAKFFAQDSAMDPTQLRKVIEAVIGDYQSLYQQSKFLFRYKMRNVIERIPDSKRREAVRIIISEPGFDFADFGLRLLLKDSKGIHAGVIDGLTAIRESSEFTGEIVAKLKLLRDWLLDESIRSGVNELIKFAMDNGIKPTINSEVPVIDSILSTGLNSDGDQIVFIGIKREGSRDLLQIYLCRDIGVGEVSVMKNLTHNEYSNAIAAELEDYDISNRFEITLDYVKKAMAVALGEGMQNGHLTEADLLDALSMLSISELKPIPADSEEIITMCDNLAKLNGMGEDEKEELIDASEFWCDLYPFIDEWEEESELDMDVEESFIQKAKYGEEQYYWRLLEKNRHTWLNQFARMAWLMEASGDEVGLEFLAVADSIAKGRSLAEIPFMVKVVDEACGY